MPETTCAPKVISVTTIWSESNHLTDGEVFATFMEARLAYRQAAWSAPRSGAYDKTKFKIEFDNGTEYIGRLDIQHPFSVAPHPTYDLLKHIERMVAHLTPVNAKRYGYTPEDIEEVKQQLAAMRGEQSDG